MNILARFTNNSSATLTAQPILFLQILNYFLVLSIMILFLTSCARVHDPHAQPLAGLPVASFTQTPPPPPHRPITATDPLVRKFNPKKSLRWLVNEGPDRIYPPEEGTVSFYHEPQRMADGKRFDPSALTAAHLTLPLYTIVRCTRVDDGRSVMVMITDRGPHVDRRILDLSRAAGRKIGLVWREGITRCRVEILAYPYEESAQK